MQNADSFSSIGRTVFSDGELLPNQTEVVQTGLRLMGDFRAIHKNVKPPREFPWYDELDQPTQVISILGPRGCGKTACLLSMCKMLHEQSPERDDSGRKPFSVLPAIIPESLTGNESLLQVLIVNLLRMLEAIESVKAEDGIMPRQKDRAAEDIRRELGKVLASLIVGTEDGAELVHQMSGDIDSYTRRLSGYQAVYQRRVFIVHAAIVEFLDNVANADMLVVPLDDVDLARHRSEESLELIKVFLSHPRIVAIVTGDLLTIRRSLRNRMLHDLPSVFTGGTSPAPEKEEQQQSSLASLFGSNKSALIANEYAQDDSYAQAYLFKVLPPAYRCELRGVAPNDRLTMQFALRAGEEGRAAPEAYTNTSPKSTLTSVAEVLRGLPLVSEFLHQSVDENNSTPTHVRVLRFVDGDRDCSWIEQAVTLYPDVLSPHLRPLVNQLVALRATIDGYRHKIRTLLSQDGTSDADVLDTVVVGDYSRRPRTEISWPNSAITSQSESPALRRGRQLESEALMKVVSSLALHPDIEADKPLFIYDRFQSNALNVTSIEEMWQLLDNVSASGTGPLGARFVHRFIGGRREGFSDASNALLSLIAEYAVHRSGRLWWVLDEIGLNLDELWGFDVAPTVFLGWFRSESAPNKSYAALCNAMRLTVDCSAAGVSDRSHVRFNPRSDRLGPPLFLESIRQAAAYSQSCLHSEMGTRMRSGLQWISEHHHKMYSTFAGEKGGRQPASADEVLRSERDFGLRLLGIVGLRGIEELAGVLVVLKGVNNAKPPKHLSRGAIRIDLPWMLTNSRSTAWYLEELLKHFPADSMEATLLLFYISSLPIVPALSACRSTPGDEWPISRILSKIVEILNAASTRWGGAGGYFAYRLNAALSGDTWTVMDSDKPPVEIEWASNDRIPREWENATSDAPVLDLRFQCQSLELFIAFLCSIQHEQSFDDDGCPTRWRTWVSDVVTKEAIDGEIEKHSSSESADDA